MNELSFDSLCELCLEYFNGDFGGQFDAGSGDTPNFNLTQRPPPPPTTTTTSTTPILRNMSNFNNTSMLAPNNSIIGLGDIGNFCEFYIDNNKCFKTDENTEDSTDLALRHVVPQLVLAFIAIVMNSVEVYLMKKRKKYYPSEYLMISLALADLLFSILVFVGFILTIVYNLYLPLHNAQLMSEVMDTLISFSIFASIVHVVAISLDRLFAVLLPLRHRVAVSAQRMKKLVVLLWCITVVMIGAITVYRYHKGFHKDSDYYTYLNSSKSVSIVMFISAAVVAIIYVAITRQLALQARFLSSIRRVQRNSFRKSKIRNRIETVALFTAIIVTVAFLVCTLPYASLMVVEGTADDNVETLCVCLLICNSILNPIVYFLSLIHI